MKKIVIFLVFLLLDAALINYGWKNEQFSVIQRIQVPRDEPGYPPCSLTIHYKIAQIDPEFTLSEAELIQDASVAAKVWNDAQGRNLFVYDPNGTLSISLVYDGRQKLSSQINQLQSSLDTQRKVLDPQEKSYQSDVDAYNKKSAELKADIDSWNEKGGAPEDVYNQLIARRDDLQRESDRLNDMSKKLNELSSDFNSQIGTLNKTVTNFNSQLGEKPEEGVYRTGPTSIEIYFNNGKTELQHTLAHEMGHAIGMDHVSDKRAIMYTSTNLTVKPTDADLAELKTTCQDDVVQPIN